MKKTKYLYLIIYILFFNLSFSQNIHLKIKGKDSVSTTFINKNPIKKSFNNIKELNTEINLLAKQLQNLGFFNLHISQKQKLNDSTYSSTLTLNKQFNHIAIKHNNINIKDLKEHLTQSTYITKTQFITKVTELETNLNNIIKLYSEKGEVFTECNLTDITTKNDSIYATLKLKNSEPKKITAIKIKGYEKFPKKFITHYLNLKKEKILNPEELKKASKNINNLIFAKENKQPEILFTKDSTVTYLYINKQKSNNFEGFLGFSSNPKNSKLDFNGHINLRLINNLNSGEELHLKYQSTENSQRTIHIKTAIPFIFNSPFSIEGEMLIFKKDSSFTNSNQKVSTNYLIGKNIKIGVGLDFQNSNSLTEETINNVDFKKTGVIGYLLHHIHHNNPLYPYKTKTHFEVSLSNRTTTTKNNQQNIHLSSEYIFDLNTTNSIHLKTSNNYLISENILENELNYIGGINSIRGYQENSIPSIRYSILNTEYRITLNKTLYTHTVFDYAIAEIANENHNLFGFGIGLGLNTNNNLLRFIIANNKNKGEEIKFSNTKIHLSLSTFF